MPLSELSSRRGVSAPGQGGAAAEFQKILDHSGIVWNCWTGAQAEKVPNGIEYELKRLYYDIAGTAYRPAIAALTSLVPTTQILFGSDDPFVPLADTADGAMQVGFSADDLRLIGHDNALTLLPRLKSS